METTSPPDDAPTDSSAPLVTVVITTYNRPSYLPQAIETVCQQTYEPLELVVVDDHSEPPVDEIVAETATAHPQQVTCVRHDENRGANAARNTGVEHASGTYVAFLDDDDRWEPEKLQRQVETFADGDDLGVVYTGMRTIHDDASSVEIPRPVTGDMTKALLCRNVVGTLSAVMVRTELARAVPLDDRFPSWADLEWYVRLSRQAPFELVAEPLVVYEFGSQNRLSDDFEKTRRSYELFLATFDQLAGQYGRLFRRKMRGWAAYRAGAAALYSGNYEQARQYLTTAVARYPFEPRFTGHLFAALGGRHTHGLASATQQLV